MMKKRDLLAGLALLPWATPALAQEYPSRPIRLLVGFAAGGSTDVFARAIAPRLQALLGQPVVIENRPGAGGNIATEATARSAPDGYTLLLGTIGPLAINPTLYGNLSFDPLKDLTPVSLVGEVPNVLAVPVDRPFRSVADIIAAAKARPETISYGTGGVGPPGHLCGILFDQIAGTRTVPVPYRGGGPQMLALVAGEHDFGFSPMGTVLTHVQAGTIRALGVATKTRARELPDVPSMIEAGLPNFEVLNWDGFVVPAGTPAPIRVRLGEVIRAALTDPGVIADFQRRGLEAWPSTEAAFARQLAADAAKWQPLIRAAGIEPS